MNKNTKRRKRRRAKAKLKDKRAVRPHREVAGRTGRGYFDRREPSKQRIVYRTHADTTPRVPAWWEVRRTASGIAEA